MISPLILPFLSFDRIRQVDEDDLEFWSARDLMRVLEYTDWRNFKGVLIKAQIASENSGHDPTDHFVGASKMVAIGSEAKREVEDMHLSRYACYLGVQNADPAKEVVALGQTYFAVQTRRQEVSDAAAMAEDLPTAESIKKLERAEKKRLAAPKTKPKKDEAE